MNTPRHVVFALLALSLGLMLFVVALRIGGQPMPSEIIVTTTNTAPEFVRTVLWTRASDASNYVLTINNSLFMLPARGTNGSTMAVSNAPFATGTNTLHLWACDTNRCGATNTLRWWISWERSEDYIGLFYSSNLVNWVPTNYPANGRLKPRKQGMGFFTNMVVMGTNYLDERALP